MLESVPTALGGPFFTGAGPELWPPLVLNHSAAGGAEMSGGLQGPTLVHPALHPQVKFYFSF
jgi:hypothetical protein